MNPWEIVLETLKLTVKPNLGAIKAHCETLSKPLQGWNMNPLEITLELLKLTIKPFQTNSRVVNPREVTL